MQIIMYGELEPKYPRYIDKQSANYSNGSGSRIKWLNDKQFARAEKKFKKYMKKQQKNLNDNSRKDCSSKKKSC